jgi:membrane protein
LLAGALAYRLFVLLLPLVLLLVSGLGIYAGAADQTPDKVAEEAGLHGLIASHVADTASSPARWIFFLVMIPAVLYALAKLYRAVAIVHALAWRGTARGVNISAAGVALLGVAVLVDLGAVGVVGWIRRHTELGGLTALVVYFAFVGGTWLLVSRRLPGRGAGWRALVPGALVIATGLLLVNVFNVYVTTRLVENQANTYGVLGIAAALLFLLVLVGRVVAIAAELNASIDQHRRAER